MSNHDLEPMDPEEAVEMYLRERSTDLADASLKGHKYRLGHFVRWCGGEGITNTNDLTGRDMHRYKLWRIDDGDLNSVSVKTQMDTVRVFIRFLESIDAVEADLSEKVLSPSLSKGENQRDVRLESDRAKVILSHLGKFEYCTFAHVLLTLLWRCGVRTGTAIL